MDAEDTGVLEAARAIRPYLPRLLGPPAAADLDGQLAEELPGVVADPAATARRLRALLDAQEDTAWFLAEVLADAPEFRPPYHQPRYTRRQAGGRGTSAGPFLPGEAGPVGGSVRFACPHGDYVFHRPDVGTPVPECRTHRVALVRTPPT